MSEGPELQIILRIIDIILYYIYNYKLFINNFFPVVGCGGN